MEQVTSKFGDVLLYVLHVNRGSSVQAAPFGVRHSVMEQVTSKFGDVILYALHVFRLATLLSRLCHSWPSLLAMVWILFQNAGSHSYFRFLYRPWFGSCFRTIAVIPVSDLCNLLYFLWTLSTMITYWSTSSTLQLLQLPSHYCNLWPLLHFSPNGGRLTGSRMQFIRLECSMLYLVGAG